MSTLDLAWVASQGAVRFTVYDVPDDDRTTVKRVNPGGTLSAIRGYPDGTWHSTTGLGYDYEAPMSALVQYAIVDRDAKNLVGVTTSTVDATNPAQNPSLEGGSLSGWGSANPTNYPVTLDSSSAMSGVYSAVSTRSGTLSTGVASVSLNAATGVRFPVAAGQPATFSVDVKTELVARRVRLSLVTYDAGGVIIGDIGGTFVLNDTVAGQVYRTSHTVTPQANAVTAYVSAQVFTMTTDNAVLGERVWFDRLRFGGTDYFDGDTAPNGPYTYRWTGTAKASPSERTITQTTYPVTAVIFTQTPGRVNGEAWLRDVMQPALSRPVSVVSTGEEIYAARQTILDVAGKSTPYVVWDSRSARQGVITLVVSNTVKPGIYDDATDRRKLEALFSSGRPLLLSLCANKGFRNAYLAVDTVTFTRRGTGPSWLVELTYNEVDNPTGLQVILVPEVTYANAAQLPPSALYSDWADTDYFTIATRTAL